MAKHGSTVAVVACIFTVLGALGTIFGPFKGPEKATPTTQPEHVVVNVQPQPQPQIQLQPQINLPAQPPPQPQPVAVANPSPSASDYEGATKPKPKKAAHRYGTGSYGAYGSNGFYTPTRQYSSREVSTDTAESLYEKVISRKTRIDVCIARNNALGDAQIDIVQKKNCVEDIVSAINYLEMNAHEIRQLAGSNPELDEALGYIRYKNQYKAELNQLNLTLRNMPRP